MEYKIAVIGDYDSVLGFKAVGFEDVYKRQPSSPLTENQMHTSGSDSLVPANQAAASLPSESLTIVDAWHDGTGADSIG